MKFQFDKVMEVTIGGLLNGCVQNFVYIPYIHNYIYNIIYFIVNKLQ